MDQRGAALAAPGRPVALFPAWLPWALAVVPVVFVAVFFAWPVASIVRRGLRFVQIPTSLLAQVDSSVGGKTAVNTPQGKNLVGSFHQPSLVLADLRTLDSLPDREMRAGYAEIVKYGLLGDAEFFAWLEPPPR